MTATTYAPLPRTFYIFSSQPHLSPVHGGLRVLACSPTALVWCSGVLVMASTCTRTPQMFERHPNVGRSHHHPRQHQGQRGDVQARHLAALKAQVVPDPPLACDAHVSLPLLVLAMVPSIAGVLFPTVRARQILLPDIDLPAEGVPGRYEQRVLDRRDMLAPAALSGGAVYTHSQVGLSPTNETRYHTPSVPWVATSRRFPLRALRSGRPSGRCGSRGASYPALTPCPFGVSCVPCLP